MRFIVTGCSHRCMCSGSPPGVGWTSKKFLDTFKTFIVRWMVTAAYVALRGSLSWVTWAQGEFPVSSIRQT